MKVLRSPTICTGFALWCCLARCTEVLALLRTRIDAPNAGGSPKTRSIRMFLQRQRTPRPTDWCGQRWRTTSHFTISGRGWRVLLALAPMDGSTKLDLGFDVWWCEESRTTGSSSNTCRATEWVSTTSIVHDAIASIKCRYISRSRSPRWHCPSCGC